jgi:hypothetical protein
MMLSFVDKKELQNDSDVLSAHAQWEANDWHQRASRVAPMCNKSLKPTNPAQGDR